MAKTARWAKGLQHSRGVVGRFVDSSVSTAGRSVITSPEELEFVRAKIAAGLSDIEVSRMFFRRFGKDFSASGVKHQRKRMSEGEGSLS